LTTFFGGKCSYASRRGVAAEAKWGRRGAARVWWVQERSNREGNRLAQLSEVSRCMDRLRKASYKMMMERCRSGARGSASLHVTAQHAAARTPTARARRPGAPIPGKGVRPGAWPPPPSPAPPSCRWSASRSARPRPRPRRRGGPTHKGAVGARERGCRPRCSYRARAGARRGGGARREGAGAHRDALSVFQKLGMGLFAAHACEVALAVPENRVDVRLVLDRQRERAIPASARGERRASAAAAGGRSPPLPAPRRRCAPGRGVSDEYVGVTWRVRLVRGEGRGVSD